MASVAGKREQCGKTKRKRTTFLRGTTTRKENANVDEVYERKRKKQKRRNRMTRTKRKGKRKERRSAALETAGARAGIARLLFRIYGFHYCWRWWLVTPGD